jgi:hypothetical protein
MPAWATVVLTLGTTLIGAAAALSASMLQLRHAHREREAASEAAWRERGAAVVGRVLGVLDDMEPQAIARSGGRSKRTMENIGRRWWQTRDDLLVFASGHPSLAVSVLAEEVVITVSNAWEDVARLNRAVENPVALAAATEAHEDTLERVRRLLEVIRRPNEGGAKADGP